MFDLIIVGAGPAGLAAALYATRKRLNFLVLSKDLGGKSNYRVELPEMDETQLIQARELVTEYKSRLEYLRHSYRLENVTKVEHDSGTFSVHTDKGAVEQARAVVIASGTRMRRSDVPGEMKYRSKGLGYSPLSYSHLFGGKILVGDVIFDGGVGGTCSDANAVPTGHEEQGWPGTSGHVQGTTEHGTKLQCLAAGDSDQCERLLLRCGEVSSVRGQASARSRRAANSSKSTTRASKSHGSGS